MKADHLTFRRATSVSLLGLVLQLVMGLTLLLYSVILQDLSAQAGALMILAGSIVWLMLAIVYDQHRRERLEAMESDAMAAASARESSVFGERADDLLVAAKRLAWMHKWLVPLASLVFAVALVGLGIWRLSWGQYVLERDSFKSLAYPGWAISIGLALAFVGFVFARYVAGMARQPAWANLRAGAAQSVGAALVGLVIAVAQFVDYLGPQGMAEYLIVGIPIAMLVIAGEVVLNFLMGLYRPRRAGEIPRPAMESRILGFAAAPDRIAESIGGALNYQFGFDVTGNWFYQLLRRSVVILLLVGLVVMWGLTSIGVVQPNEQGLRIRNGDLVEKTPLLPGAYVKLPWPLERIERFNAATVRRLDLGGEQPKVKGSILWTNDHGVAEQFFVVRPSGAELQNRATPTEADVEAVAGGSDVTLVSAEVPLLFEITDLAKYERLAATDQRDGIRVDQREEILLAIARREVFTYLATQPVDRVLGRGRTEISKELRTRIERAVNEELPVCCGLPDEKGGAGVRVLFVGIEGVHPPKESAEMFESVVQSGQKRQGAIENGIREADATLIKVAGSVEMARKIVAAIDAREAAVAVKAPAARIAELESAAEKLLLAAGGDAASTLQTAKADRWVTHMAARGRAEGSAGQLASYRAAPAVYTAQLYFDTMRELLSQARVYIVADEPGKLFIETNLEEAAPSGSVFDSKKSEE